MDWIGHIHWRFLPLLIVCGTIDGAEDDVEVTVQRVAVQRVVGLLQPVFLPRVTPFDQVVFGCSEEECRWKVELQISHRIIEMGVTYRLTDEQLTKLDLAAKVELRHFFHDVDDLRRQSEAIEIVRDGRNPAELIERKTNLFASDSLFAKVSAKIITAEQTATHRQMIQKQTGDRMHVRHRVNIDGVIREFERRLYLRTFQKVSLIRLMLDEIEPPKVFGNFDDMVLKYRLMRLSEGKLRPLFNDDQWPRVCKILDEFRDFRPVLIRHGLIENPVNIRSLPDQEDNCVRPGATDRNSPADANSPANRGED